MHSGLRAIEVEGSIDEHQHLHLDAPLQVQGPSRVRVLVLIPEQDEPSESEWLRAAARNPAFAFLADPEEDLYTVADGALFADEG